MVEQGSTDFGKLGKLVRGDLDWIVMKAIEKDRSRRFDTANALAADIRRYLRGDTVEAVAPTFGYRLGKFVRRNKAGIGVAAIITPWNAPLMLATWRIGPALASGDTVVLKPPEWAPLT